MPHRSDEIGVGENVGINSSVTAQDMRRPSSWELKEAKRRLPSSQVALRSEQRKPFSFDRPFHAAIAQSTMGISPAALIQTYTDWALHLLLSPDKQVELSERALRQWIRLSEYCLRASIDPGAAFCIDPLPQDRRSRRRRLATLAVQPVPAKLFADPAVVA
ncbi:poly-beta-hydroxybutyrate polymerase N-terminal domain-containing protein [Methylocystis sp. IM2]|uniref:poly-beta-hydroxybutyrate polymerase N-terminal domain-containing protein n=1 Tax=Methylocystis sp. IM2 TaxID=3136563 RepID=UPI0030FBAF5F